ncbi:MAG: hypothetical protein E7575_07270 [Ruminococcaceae bacterium]|nr:hypothetical protein [Oscillospiraceae bacterium]
MWYIINVDKGKEAQNLSNFDLQKTNINLIPESSRPTGSYVCTWWNQSAAAEALGLEGTGLSQWRDALNSDALFGENNFYHPATKEERSGLIFLLDDGWDLPLGTPNDAQHRHLYGSVDPDPVKFAAFGSTPAKRLLGISEKVKEMGYAGLGLWISPQEKNEGEYDERTAREYWETRAKWCAEAGVSYWKVDWGTHDWDDDYRKMISECARKYAPDLWVEHAVIQLPCTHNHRSFDFIKERQARVKKQMEFADAYRTYDVIDPFDNVCTLQRAHEALMQDPKKATGRAFINGENLYSVCASLGLCTGIMNYNNDARACVNWQRLSPPFSIKDGSYICSREILTDTMFCESELCEWAPCKGLTVKESAPAIMARNCPLPTVHPCAGASPFITASKNPETGAYAVAAIRRTIDPIPGAHLPANVTIHDVNISSSLGVFGVFNSLTVEFSEKIPKNVQILAQDLTGTLSLDITKKADMNDQSITLDGKLLRMIGKWERGTRDPSEPSLVITLRGT